VIFFVGLHFVSHAQRFARACVSINRLRARKSDFVAADWIMDSGAFTEVTTYWAFRQAPEVYAAEIRRWRSCGNLLAAVAQDYMCESFALACTGLTVPEHQGMTIARYDALLAAEPGAYVMPVLQGFDPTEYVQHLGMYGNRLSHGQWVGVGSVCKRNADPREVVRVLGAIKDERPDLRLHGFGVKLTSLASGEVRALLHSADSMAWSYSARKQGRDSNDWREARDFAAKVNDREFQSVLCA
jgi:hypothetical protein